MIYPRFFQILALIGVISNVFGQTEGPPPANEDPFSQNDVLYIDPFMPQKCAAKGIELKELSTTKDACIKKAGDENLNSTGGQDDMTQAMTVICRIRTEIDICLKPFINGMKQCYDTDDQKKQVEKAKDVINFVYDYICQDDAKKLKDTFRTFGNIFCLMKMVAVTDECSKNATEGTNITSLFLQNEETCLLSYEIAECMVEPIKDCDSTAPYEFFAGLMDASMDASECSKYELPRMYNPETSAASSYSTCLALIICIAGLASKF